MSLAGGCARSAPRSRARRACSLRANDSWAGLAGSVWTADAATANRVGSRMVCGYVWVNDHGATRLDLRAPFGGMKQSGFGRDRSLHALEKYTELKGISITYG